LLRDCPMPIWAERASRRHHGWRVMASVDVGAAGSSTTALSDRILEAARAVARDDTRLWVLHSWRLEGERLLSGMGRITPASDPAELERGERRAHRAALDDLLARHGLEEGRDVSVELARGDPAATIPEAAKRLD